MFKNKKGQIQDDVTVWDPKGLEKPWHVVNYYKPVTTPNVRINYWSCDANNNVIRTPTGGSTFILPGEVKTVKRPYREPQEFYLTAVQKVLYDSNKPIVLTATEKKWLRIHLQHPERYESYIGPIKKSEMKEREMAQKKMMEMEAKMRRERGGG